MTIGGDLAEEGTAIARCEQTVAKFGGLDLLVNNVAYQEPVDDLTKLSPEQWHRTFASTSTATSGRPGPRCAHLAAAPCIINTASINGLRGNKSLIDYAATKGAVLALTYSLAQALQERGIRVNTVAPGPVWTPLIPATLPRKGRHSSAARHRWNGPPIPMRSRRPTCSSRPVGCRRTTPVRYWRPSEARRCRADPANDPAGAGQKGSPWKCGGSGRFLTWNGTEPSSPFSLP